MHSQSFEDAHGCYLQEGFDDFTIASPWERLISDVERACRKWQSFDIEGLMTAGAIRTEGCEKLYHVQTEFAHCYKDYRLTFFFQVDFKHDGHEDWRDNMHLLQLWFGVKDFFVIAPKNMSGVVLDAPEATALLSAVAIALSNCGSCWPAFVPVHDPTRMAYKGIQGMRGPYSRSFEADRLGSQVPVKLMHLEGLYDLFISKVDFSFPASTSHLNMKVRFTMRLTYHTPMPGFEFVHGDHGVPSVADPVENFDGDISEKIQWDDNLPWAEWYSVDDPVKGFELIAVWASRLVESSAEMAEFENVSTSEADKWLLQLVLAKNFCYRNNGDKDDPITFASRLKSLIMAFSVSKEAEFMEDFSAGDKPELERYLIGTTVPPPGVLDRVLKDLFHEGSLIDRAREDTPHHLSRAIKGAPTESLFSQFCLQALWFGTCNIRAIATLWTEFVREVRWCWEELQPLPRMSQDQAPDLDACLIHQKLQLLAVCIHRKAAEQRHISGIMDHGDLQETGGTINEGMSDKASSLSECFPQDVHSVCEGLACNFKPDSHILNAKMSFMSAMVKDGQENSIPAEESVKDFMQLNLSQNSHGSVAQELPIMTEDMLLEQQQALLALSQSSSGNMAMSRLQGNIPAADCEVQEQLETTVSQSGKLLQHLPLSGNTLEMDQILENVKDLPAAERKPLFDHTREGEKVIHYLETVRPHQLLSQMICTAFSATADLLSQTDTGKLKPLLVELDQLYLTIVSILEPLRTLNIPGFVDEELSSNVQEWCTEMIELCRVFERAEKHVIMAASLLQKLSKSKRLVNGLFNDYVKMYKQQQGTSAMATHASTDNQVKSFCQTVSMSERDAIANLFPPLSSSETWKKSLRMGNFLNGHEPLIREVIFSHIDDYFQGQRERYRIETPNNTSQLLSHRMYIRGTANDLQVAYSVVSDD